MTWLLIGVIAAITAAVFFAAGFVAGQFHAISAAFKLGLINEDAARRLKEERYAKG